MTKIEYKIVLLCEKDLYKFETNENDTLKNLEEKYLNSESENGWELISVVPPIVINGRTSSEGWYKYYWKRIKNDFFI
jgi:hypothetical protein